MDRNLLIETIMVDYTKYAIDCFEYTWGDSWHIEDLTEDLQSFRDSLKNYTTEELSNWILVG